MKLLNKIGDINGTVLSMEPNAAQQPFQHGKVALGTAPQSRLHAGPGRLAQPSEKMAQAVKARCGFGLVQHSIPPHCKILNSC